MLTRSSSQNGRTGGERSPWRGTEGTARVEAGGPSSGAPHTERTAHAFHTGDEDPPDRHGGRGGGRGRLRPRDDGDDGRSGRGGDGLDPRHHAQPREEALGLAKAIEQANATTGPEIILLQEVCGDMLQTLRAPGWTVQFHQRRANKCVGTDTALGEAVVWTGAGGQPFKAVELLAKDDQKYGMACLDVKYSNRNVRACSTHLVASRRDETVFRSQLTAKIRVVTNRWIADKRTVVLGGDFNTRPTFREMDAIYGVGKNANGKFREMAQSAGKSGSTARDGLWTSGRKTDTNDTRRKIDYVFVSMNAAAATGGSQNVQATPSDHRMLYGRMPLR
ncbi:endonuclease/exonuclease/phosphatase family protein [Phycicoccus sp. MAQZ13P-2]|nr:endonuclease/exonuclease/phosphatase family protein [Phycicoccus mangrovi]MBT9275912.1 endonuclease/exonuclease/phosphatase family protein [Phycicoccus mangrovi]